MLTGEQMRAARALLRMEQRQLAEAADVSLETIKRLEKMEGEVTAYKATVAKIIYALEKAGVHFVDPNGLGAGVRLREK